MIVPGYRSLPSHRSNQVLTFDRAGVLVLSVILASMAFGLNQSDTGDIAASQLSIKALPFLLARVFIRTNSEARIK